MTKVYKLTKKLRERLAKPFGIIFKEPGAARNVHMYLKENRTALLIAVGDMTSENLIDYGRFPHICIVDGKTKRGPYLANWNWSGIFKARIVNPAGGIEDEACIVLDSIIELVQRPISCRMNKAIIFVEGEEDLLVLPCVKYAPIGSVVVYGQPDVGIVLIEVNEKVKAEVEEILGKMEHDESI